jgi:hypothetical protein
MNSDDSDVSSGMIEFDSAVEGITSFLERRVDFYDANIFKLRDFRSFL